MFLTKEKLQDARVPPSRFYKFVELFPNGTEVTRELCLEHPNIFSFGFQGGYLIPANLRDAYWDKLSIVSGQYVGKLALLLYGRPVRRRNPLTFSQLSQIYVLGMRSTRATPISKPKLDPKLEESKIEREQIGRDCNLESALLFYDYSIM
jgi:hypothetical protein